MPEKASVNMKKSIFRENRKGIGWIYTLMCIAVVAVSATAVVSYQQTANKLVDDISDSLDTIVPELDYSAVDKVISDIQDSKPSDSVMDIPQTLEEVFYEKAVYMPISNAEVIREFSFHELAKSTSGVWQTHDGVDLKAAVGTPVKAMTSGKVSRVYSDALWGNCVEIDHGDSITGYYFGLSNDISVATGDEVNAGQVIGYVGNTEIESDMDEHLHFALKHADEWIDPISYIEPYK